MDIAERSRERVEECLERLEGAYGSFPVSQTTVSLPGERYERVREGGTDGFVDAYVEVRDEDSAVLHVDSDDDGDLPGVRIGLGDDPEPRLRETVRDAAGIECSVDGLERVQIAGLRNADDPERGTIYRVVAVFTGRRTAGVVEGDAGWHRSMETVELPIR